MRSLQARLGAGLLLTSLAVFFVLWIMVSGAIHDVAEDNIASRLAHDSESLLSAVSFNADGALLVDDARIGAIYHRPFSGHYYQLNASGSWVFSRSLWDKRLVTEPVRVGASKRFYLVGPQQQSLLVLVHGYRKAGRDITVVVAEDLGTVEKNIKDFQWRFGGITVVMLALLMVAGLVIVRTDLHPLQRIRQEVRALEHGERKELTVVVPREIEPLVTEINRLLLMLGKRLQRSRHALGDLAHALKKPLTVLTQLQRDSAIASSAQLRQTYSTQVNTMQQIIHRQLRRARMAGNGHGGIYFDVKEDLSALLDALQKMYQQKAIEIRTDVDSNLRIIADREDILELLGNLLDNACKWARRRVRLTMRNGKRLFIRVEDDGSGVDEHALAELSQRGKRLDESVEGHGLGLAIVGDIAEQYHGELKFGASKELGGLCVDIAIPISIHGNS